MTAVPVVDDLLITAEGHERLRSELALLRSEGRRGISERLREARDDGHLDDNPGLLDVFEEQAQLERRIAVLEERLAGARIAEPNGDGTAGIGSSVLLRDLETNETIEFRLVGALEADIAQGRVTVDAPVGRALLGATAGGVVSVAGPRRELRYEVIDVDRAPPTTPARIAA